MKLSWSTGLIVAKRTDQAASRRAIAGHFLILPCSEVVSGVITPLSEVYGWFGTA